MTRTAKTKYSESIVEDGGRLWKSKPGATGTGEEFLAARKLFLELHQESAWNPWVLEDRVIEIEQATDLMGQWTRVEPGHRVLTEKQITAKFKSQDLEFEKLHVIERQRFQENSRRYDPALENARLALLEQQSRLDYEMGEVKALRSGERFPAMDPVKRAERVAELNASITVLQAEVGRLLSHVGDPEQVVDLHGRLPGDRRVIMLTVFTARRSSEVRALRAMLPELTATLQAATDKSARAAARLMLEQATSRLDGLLAIPRPVAEDMCSECPTLIMRHGWRALPAAGPCPAWPRWAANIRQARRILETFVRDQRPAEPAMPKATPKPLAVVPSGLPIADVIAQLTELQAKHPNSVVRRGRANRWELWPNQATED